MATRTLDCGGEMSARDAVSRRRHAVETLKRNMHLADTGWKLNKMVTLILRDYGHGITAKRAISIIEQLTKYKDLYKHHDRWYLHKPKK